MTEILHLNHRSNAPFAFAKQSRDQADNLTTLSSVIEEGSLHQLNERLKTFTSWPNSYVQPQDLAEAGFFYTGIRDKVECAFCGIVIHNWVEHDIPMADHKKWNNNCPFVQQNSSNNSERDNNRTPRRLRNSSSSSGGGEDICGNLGVEVLPNSEPEDPERATDLERLGIQRARGPTHPDKIIYEHRLKTFKNWPKSMRQKPHDLASAGFFYLGTGDQTLCFSCGGGLKDWEEDDDPWEQHALWFPKCNYLLLKKTQSFVDQVHAKKTAKALTEGEEVVEVEEENASCVSSCTKDEHSSTSLVSGEEEKEKENGQSGTLCKICYKNELGVVFLPCGHMVACTDCASALKECAVCRKPIQATVRVFLS